MDNRRIFGILLLTLGVALLVIGMDVTRPFSSSSSQMMQSVPSEKAFWLFIVGGILGPMGLMETLRRRRMAES
jgi:hypothetical protein